MDDWQETVCGHTRLYVMLLSWVTCSQWENSNNGDDKWWKNFDDTFSRLDTVPMCDRQTERQASYDSVVRTVHLRASSNSETILLVPAHFEGDFPWLSKICNPNFETYISLSIQKILRNNQNLESRSPKWP